MAIVNDPKFEDLLKQVGSSFEKLSDTFRISSMTTAKAAEVTKTAQFKLRETLEKMPPEMRGALHVPPGFTITKTSKPTLSGVKIIEDKFMVDYVEDWSKCRSPSRAKRRRRQGHAQHVFMREVPKKEIWQFEGSLIMHPVRAAELRKRLVKDIDDLVFKDMCNLLHGKML